MPLKHQLPSLIARDNISVLDALVSRGKMIGKSTAKLFSGAY
jgi:hypothetical protein